ncbi:MAG: transcriptional repressor NrdR [Oscillospiraceae bacterium]|nr:transcriptional repressor NrdR [Oscillospiraceae bacterium]
MKCPFCGNIDSKVIDSRPTEDNQRIRRRRECMACQKRFTTFEIVEITPIMVVKKDGSIEAFNRDKVLAGMVKSCEKRQVSKQDLEKAADSIEYKLVNSLKSEVSSIEIGEMVMDELKKLDEVAYVRFASVYRQFSDVNTFFEELSELLKKKTDKE